MKVVKVKQSNNVLYNITFDDNNTYKLAEDVVVKYRLFVKNTEISEETLIKILEENVYYLALNAAYKYIEVLHSKKEIKDHLLKKYEYKTVIEVLNRLTEQNLINEREYSLYMLNYARRNLKGIIYLEQELKFQEISQIIIEEALLKYDDELDICNKCFEKNMKNYKNISLKEYKHKMQSFLTGRGFSYNNIIITLEKNQALLDNIINNSKALTFQYQKIEKQLANKKLSKEEKEKKITQKLLAKGFSIEEINKVKRSRG